MKRKVNCLRGSGVLGLSHITRRMQTFVEFSLKFRFSLSVELLLLVQSDNTFISLRCPCVSVELFLSVQSDTLFL